MSRKISDRKFRKSAMKNTVTYYQYFDRLTELATSMFEWKNLPDTIDERFLEMTLFTDGCAVFFKDDVLGFLCLQVATGGGFNVYRIPLNRRAYSVNGYNAELNIENSVIIYNNYLKKNSITDIKVFSERLSNLDNAIDVNANAQKTPLLIKCEESQRLTMQNVYKEYDGNMPVLFGDKGLSDKSFAVLKTDAPYVADKLYMLKTNIWNEALTYLGISNTTINKKERLVTDEVARNMGGVIASRYSRLEMRRKAAKEINDMFGLNIEVNYREDYETLNDNDVKEGETNE